MNANAFLAQARAESAAVARLRNRYASESFKQGHRTGWREAVEWLVRSHRVQWEARVAEVWPKLLIAGIDRTPRDIDLAVDSARQSLHDDDAVWYDPDTTHGWEVLEPHVLRFLDLDDAELAAVA